MTALKNLFAREVSMKNALIMVLTAVFVFGVSHNAGAIHDLAPEGTKQVEPGADAAKLYTYIMKPKPYYDQWKLWPNKTTFAEGNRSHGSFMTTYVNKMALESLKTNGEMAYGSLIVTENYSDQKKLQTLTVMYKIKGYNPDAGDWFWAKYDALNGYVLASGKEESCIGCHGSKRDNDYLHSEK
jgi:hypothetical protein